MEDVSISIGEQLFRYWSEVEIKLSIDTHATIKLKSPFEADRSEFREAFRPFTFPPITIKVGGELLFTGTLIDVDPDADSSGRTVTATAYSKPGVLDDCTPHASSFPLEFRKMTLSAIAAQLGRPYGIEVEVEGDQGAPFAHVACEPERMIADFLIDLAKQRGMIISSRANGKLVFWRSVFSGNPVAILHEGLAPLTRLKAQFNPQEYYTELTGITGCVGGKRGSRRTLKDWQKRRRTKKRREEVGLAKFDSDVVRSLTVKLDDIEAADITGSMSAKMGRMFANMASYSTGELPTWRDQNGALWAPNKTVRVLSPSAMVYSETELLVRELVLKQLGSGDNMRETAELNLVLLGGFSGASPENWPWDG